MTDSAPATVPNGDQDRITDSAATVRYDERGNFLGHEPRECGDHRTVGTYRAWCHDCGEWCYPASPCVRCEIVELRKVRNG